MLKLFYITKDPAVARIAQAAGVDRIFVDMEYIGKAQRQGGMDTVQNHHTVEDVARCWIRRSCWYGSIRCTRGQKMRSTG